LGRDWPISRPVFSGAIEAHQKTLSFAGKNLQTKVLPEVVKAGRSSGKSKKVAIGPCGDFLGQGYVEDEWARRGGVRVSGGGKHAHIFGLRKMGSS